MKKLTTKLLMFLAVSVVMTMFSMGAFAENTYVSTFEDLKAKLEDPNITDILVTSDATPLEISGDLTVPAHVTLKFMYATINNGVTITNNGTIKAEPDNALTNNGTITNNGTFTVLGSSTFENNGTFDNSSTFTNNGTFSNLGTFNNSGLAAEFISIGTFYIENTSGAVFNNTGGATLDISGNFTIGTAGTLYNDSTSTINHTGKSLFHIIGTFNNQGTFTSNSVISFTVDTLAKLKAALTLNGSQDKNIYTDGDITLDSPITIQSGTSLSTGSGFTLTSNHEIINNGNLFIQNALYNNGGITNNSYIETYPGSLMGSGLVTNKENATFTTLVFSEVQLTDTIADNFTTLIDISGSFTLNGNLTLPSSKDLTINSTLTIADGVTFSHAGKLTMDGDIVNNGVLEIDYTNFVMKSGSISGSGDTSFLVDNEAELVAALGDSFSTKIVLAEDINLTSSVTVPSGKTLFIPSGKTLTTSVGETIINNGIIENNGTLNNLGTLLNHGTFTNNSGAILINDGFRATFTNSDKGTLTNHGTITNENNAKFVNYVKTAAELIAALNDNFSISIFIASDITLNSSVTVPQDKYLSTLENKTLTISSGGSIDVYNKFGNVGTLIIEDQGSINVMDDGALTNYSTVNNHGTITKDSTATITNSESATFKTFVSDFDELKAAAEDTFTTHIELDAGIIIDTTFDLPQGKTLIIPETLSLDIASPKYAIKINNYGTIINQGTLKNYVNFTNSTNASFENHGFFENGDLFLDAADSSTFINYGEIVNHKEMRVNNSFENKVGATFDNKYVFHADSTGTVSNYGTFNNHDYDTILIINRNSTFTNVDTAVLKNAEDAEIVIDIEGKLTNTKSALIENEGLIENLDQFINEGTLQNLGNSTFSNNEGAVFTNETTGKLQLIGISSNIENEGLIKNYNYVENNGNISTIGNASFETYVDTFTELKSAAEDDFTTKIVINADITAEADFTISSGKTLLIPEQFTLTLPDYIYNNYGTIINEGTLTNRGALFNENQITNANGATIYNEYTIDNRQTFDNHGNLYNADNITNTDNGIFNNTSLIENSADGYIGNDNVFNNTGKILNGGKIENRETFTNSEAVTNLDDGQFFNYAETLSELKAYNEDDITTNIVLNADITLDSDMTIPSHKYWIIFKSSTLNVPEGIMLTNKGNMTVGFDCTLIIGGTFVNDNYFLATPDSVLENAGNITNGGELTLGVPNFTNEGIFINNSKLTFFPHFINKGTFINNDELIKGDKDAAILNYKDMVNTAEISAEIIIENYPYGHIASSTELTIDTAEHLVKFDYKGAQSTLFPDTSYLYVTVENDYILKDFAPTLTAKDHIFSAWYDDKALENEWNIEKDKVTKSITLYPGWNFYPDASQELNKGVENLPETDEISKLTEEEAKKALEDVRYLIGNFENMTEEEKSVIPKEHIEKLEELLRDLTYKVHGTLLIRDITIGVEAIGTMPLDSNGNPIPVTLEISEIADSTSLINEFKSRLTGTPETLFAFDVKLMANGQEIQPTDRLQIDFNMYSKIGENVLLAHKKSDGTWQYEEQKIPPAGTASIVVNSLSPFVAIGNVETTFYTTVAPTTNGTVTVDKPSAKMGETVTVTVTPNSGYKVGDITTMYGTKPVSTTKTATGYTFVMPSGDVLITASFIDESATPTTSPTTPQTGDYDSVLPVVMVSLVSLIGFAFIIRKKLTNK